MESSKNHVVQSPEWGQIKTRCGTEAVRAGGVQYTKHKIPFTGLYFGYCPKSDPSRVDFDTLAKSAKENSCVVINFDCPNIVSDSPDAQQAESLLKTRCTPAAKTTFAPYNILLDLTPSEEELLAKMHYKTRYNIRYAEKNGIKVEESKDLETFLGLQRATASRQKFYIHPDSYFKNVWEVLSPAGIAKLLIAKYQGKPVSAWMLFVYQGVLYYPYGGWEGKHQNLFPNNLVCWEAIKMGKRLGCQTFDMWGAAKDPSNSADPWHGFTKFKMGFGGRHVEYIGSYDLIIRPEIYRAFNIANRIRWATLNTIK